MSVNNIKDIKNVDSENFDYLLAESNFRIESVFRQKNKRVIEPNVPMTTAIDFDKPADWTAAQKFAKPGNKGDTKTGATFDFIMTPNEYGLVDLRDGEFIVQAQYAYTDSTSASANEDGFVNPPNFGNQCLLSLFQQITLYIDDQEVQCNKYPGFSSNAEYALRYPHCKTLEEDYEIQGFCRTNPEKYDLTDYTGGSTANANKTAIESIERNMKKFKHQGITCKCLRYTDASDIVHYLYTGFITQRIKLADIFSVVDTLPPLYNHGVLVRFNRTPNNDIICNTCTRDGSKCQFLGFNKFKLYQDVYVTTDQFIATAKKYYSKPIETLITQDKQYFQPIVSEPTGASSQEFNINIDAAYKNKLLTLAIPRTTNFAYQANLIGNHYQALTSSLTGNPTIKYVLDGNDTAGNMAISAAITGNSYSSDNANNSTGTAKHYDVLKAPANSYTYGGLRQLEITNVSAGTKLYTFEMESDGVLKPNAAMIDTHGPTTQHNYGNDTEFQFANYQDVYKQYVKARLHFQQSEEEALDYQTFMKEYCIFCVDLSPFDISPGDQIKIAMTFSSWPNHYNPYYAYNCKDATYTPTDAAGNHVAPRYVSTNIICNLFCDKVLRLLPNHQIQLADMISASVSEVENATMA